MSTGGKPMLCRHVWITTCRTCGTNKADWPELGAAPDSGGMPEHIKKLNEERIKLHSDLGAISTKGIERDDFATYWPKIFRLSMIGNDLFNALEDSIKEREIAYEKADASDLALSLERGEKQREEGSLLWACQLAYRKHVMDDESIGWDELGDHLLDAICNAIGDDGYEKWKAMLAAAEKEKP